jgi:hypothetical protein
VHAIVRPQDYMKTMARSSRLRHVSAGKESNHVGARLLDCMSIASIGLAIVWLFRLSRVFAGPVLKTASGQVLEERP